MNKNLIVEIQNAVNSGKPASDALMQITNIKNNLLSQIDSSSQDLTQVKQLEELEHSIYRYNMFVKAGLDDDAYEEAKKIDKLLEVCIDILRIIFDIRNVDENSKYMWHALGDACSKCKALDGKIFKNKKELPLIPHPNCRCFVTKIK